MPQQKQLKEITLMTTLPRVSTFTGFTQRWVGYGLGLCRFWFVFFIIRRRRIDWKSGEWKKRNSPSGSFQWKHVKHTTEKRRVEPVEEDIVVECRTPMEESSYGYGAEKTNYWGLRCEDWFDCLSPVSGHIIWSKRFSLTTTYLCAGQPKGRAGFSVPQSPPLSFEMKACKHQRGCIWCWQSSLKEKKEYFVMASLQWSATMIKLTCKANDTDRGYSKILWKVPVPGVHIVSDKVKALHGVPNLLMSHVAPSDVDLGQFGTRWMPSALCQAIPEQHTAWRPGSLGCACAMGGSFDL